MSYETVDEIRDRTLTSILTDTSDIEKSDEEKSQECFQFFGNLILNDLWSGEKLDRFTVGEPIDCWIAGGCIRNYFLNEKFSNDIDIFFPNLHHYKIAENFLMRKGGKSIFSNKNCHKISLDGKTFDLIKIHFSNAPVCISNFDFTVCSASITKEGFISHKMFFPHLKSMILKELCPNPETIKFRIEKYKKMGFLYEF